MCERVFSSPMGYLYFYSVWSMILENLKAASSRPLWGIYISIQKLKKLKINYNLSSRPLWGIYISILAATWSDNTYKHCSRPLWGIYISIPVSSLYLVPIVRCCSRPLWGIYISIRQENQWLQEPLQRSRPLWGIYISIQKGWWLMKSLSNVLVPYGVSIFLFLWKMWKQLFISVLVPYGVSIFLFSSTFFKYGLIQGNSVLVPYGVSIFLFGSKKMHTPNFKAFSSPMGYLYFYSQEYQWLQEP